MAKNDLTQKLLDCGPALADISHWQRGNIVDAINASTLAGVIHKATQGTKYSKVKFFTDRAHSIKKPFGSYHFANCNAGEARAEARYYASVLNSTPTQIPPVLDFEKRDRIAALGKAGASRWINEFIEELRKRGNNINEVGLYTCGYYATRSQLDPATIDWEGVFFWFPYYVGRNSVVNVGGDVVERMRRKKPKPRSLPGWPAPKIWQWTESGRIPQFGSGIDLNVADNVWIDKALNNEQPIIKPPVTVKPDAWQGLPKEVIAAAKATGASSKQARALYKGTGEAIDSYFEKV